jgi:hypothetical protein
LSARNASAFAFSNPIISISSNDSSLIIQLPFTLKLTHQTSSLNSQTRPIALNSLINPTFHIAHTTISLISRHLRDNKTLSLVNAVSTLRPIQSFLAMWTFLRLKRA